MDSDDSSIASPTRRRADDSDTESQLLAEQNALRLQAENDDLRKENSRLRAQFDRAVELARGIEELHQKNNKLTSQLHTIEGEKADLNRRLDIALRANDELAAQSSEERQRAAQQRHQDQSETEREILRIKESTQSKIESANRQLLNATQLTETQTLELRTLHGKIHQVTKAGSEFFEKRIASIDELIELLSAPPVPVPIPKPEEPKPIVRPNEAEAALTKIKRQKGHLRAARKEIEVLRAEIAQLEREKRNQPRPAPPKPKISEDELDAKLSENSSIIQDLRSKNEALRSECLSLQKQLNGIAAHSSTAGSSVGQASVSVPEVRRNDVNRELTDEIESLKQTLSETKERLKRTEAKQVEVTEKLGVAERARRQLEIDLEKREADLASSQLVREAAVAEIKTLRESLHAKPAPPNPKKTQNVIRGLKSQVSQLEHTVAAQEKTIHELTLGGENERQENKTLISKLQKRRDKLREAEQKIENLTTEVADTRAELREKPVVTIDDLLPASAWRTSEFDPELAQQIDKIASNGLLQPPSKLTQIYRVIAKYFNDRLAQSERYAASISEAYDLVKGRANQFAIDASVAVSLDAMNFDALLKGGGQQIVQEIRKIIQALDDAKRVNNQFAALGQLIEAQFGEAPDLFAKVTEVREAIDAQDRLVKSKVKKIRDLRNRLRESQADADTKIEELEAENAGLSATIADLNTTLGNNGVIVKRLKKELNEATQRLKEIEESAADSEFALKSERDTVADSYKKTTEKLQQQLSDQITRLTAQLENAGDTIAANEASILRLQKANHASQKAINEKTDQFTALQTVKDAEIDSIIAQSRKEKDNLAQSYEKVIEELKGQCDAHRADLEKVSQDLSESDARIRQAKASILSLRREKLKLETEIKALTEKSEREAQVGAVALKSAQLNAEAAASQKLQELRTKSETEKRRLFSIAGDEFRAFFDAAVPIDERSYRGLLLRVKTELKRLTDSEAVVKRLVGAGPKQTIDDAVAQLVIH
jgi:chromosome segregation ATPase